MSRPLIQSTEPTTSMSTPEPADELGGLAVDAAVDVDLGAVGLVLDRYSRAASSFSWATSRHERLAAEARLDRHHQDDVEHAS